VTYGADGKVETVRYSMLTAMLLNELQKQSRENQREAEQIKRLSAQVAELKAIFDQAMATKITHTRLTAGRRHASLTPSRRAAGDCYADISHDGHW
jgi:DNA-binding protein H-NS